MITISLARTVAYFQRRGVDLACLEGAPWGPFSGAKLEAIRPMDLGDGSRIRCDAWLYLGSDKVCPAAMGWAAMALGGDHIAIGAGYVGIDKGSAEIVYNWAGAAACPDDHTVQRILDGKIPKTPAERLRAVLEYEMERA